MIFFLFWENIESEDKMLFVAEIGLNHNGNFDLAYELIKQAKLAGADIVKFQLGWKQGPGEINHINFETLTQLKNWCNYFEIEFMASIFTEEAYKMVKEIGMTRYKIASRTLKDNFNLAKQVISEGKETFISLGMWDQNDLPFDSHNAKYLWCRSKYPAFPWDMLDFPKDFTNSRYEGYSDHTIGIETALIAISRGALIIEKHFTLDKSDTTIRDHALSATPDEFSFLVNLGRDIYKKIKIGV